MMVRATGEIVTKEALQGWLEEHGIYPPSERGHGQATSDDLAEALIGTFVMIPIDHLRSLLVD